MPQARRGKQDAPQRAFALFPPIAAPPQPRRPRPQPPAIHKNRLPIARPRRRSMAQKAQRPPRPGRELETPAHRNRQRIARRYRLRPNPRRARRTPPNPTLPLKDVPNLLHRPVIHRARNLPRRQRHLHHTATPGAMPPVHQQPDLRPIRGDRIRRRPPTAQRRRPSRVQCRNP